MYLGVNHRGLTPLGAFWNSYNGICLYMTHRYLSYAHTAVGALLELWMKELVGVWRGFGGWGVAIVTRGWVPPWDPDHEWPSHTLTEKHTAIPAVNIAPFHVYTSNNKYTFKFYRMWLCQAFKSHVDFTLFYILILFSISITFLFYFSTRLTNSA
jgi:hypothetical protein